MKSCEVDIDDDCVGEAEYLVLGLHTRRYCCGPCLEHAPGDVDIVNIKVM